MVYDFILGELGGIGNVLLLRDMELMSLYYSDVVL